ncbi:MAG: Glu/Leu/Phe/Val dehydrogenase [Candidatus Peribacteraceae bacterium]|nr:Glu/Leu/Phe/Val dehydrogenase [Candidatus Peribacteraceae bacterium]
MDAKERQSKILPILHEFIDSSVGLHAYIVIDSLRDGNSCGGLRISDDLTVEEIKALARGMTLKYCFLKLNTGGAKSGIIMQKNCTNEQRKKILEAFGRKASSLLRKKTYVPWTDLNSSVNDISTIMNAAGCGFKGISDSAYFTALTVSSAVKAACESKGIDISTISVIIEGFGGVGMNIASELSNWGAKIAGISTVKGALFDSDGLNIDKLIELRKKYKDDLVYHYGAECLERKELLLEMNTDVLIPCARTWSINSMNMKNIKAKMIVPGANAPLTEEAEEFFHKKGILYLPDFICNLGGVFGTSLYDNGNRKITVHRFIMNEFCQLVKELIIKSIKENRLSFEIAKAVAEENCIAKDLGRQHKSWMKKFVIKVAHKDIHFQRFIPGLQAWDSLQNQRRIFAENIEIMKRL